jgi:ectoine hydroxylase-related dioxygenase (phytanoyl-CoA dioxygenase family)
MTEELGAVKICVGSHKDGLVRVHISDAKHPDKKGAYGLVLENEEEIVKKYEKVSPLLLPTDLLIVDFLTVHSSGHNKSNRSRWSMQMRYFNFREPTGIDLGWVGSFTAGVDVKTIHPDLFVD